MFVWINVGSVLDWFAFYFCPGMRLCGSCFLLPGSWFYPVSHSFPWKVVQICSSIVFLAYILPVEFWGPKRSLFILYCLCTFQFKLVVFLFKTLSLLWVLVKFMLLTKTMLASLFRILLFYHGLLLGLLKDNTCWWTCILTSVFRILTSNLAVNMILFGNNVFYVCVCAQML